MNEKEEVLVRVQQYPGKGWDWDDIVELDVTFDEFMDTICRAAHQHGKAGIPYDGRLGKVCDYDMDEDGNFINQREVEGIVDEFDPWDHF
tara:strand:- start:540 stop:809 length:270 start_codon:yes stop_codon:yes gene_type:complete